MSLHIYIHIIIIYNYIYIYIYTHVCVLLPRKVLPKITYKCSKDHNSYTYSFVAKVPSQSCLCAFSVLISLHVFSF